MFRGLWASYTPIHSERPSEACQHLALLGSSEKHSSHAQRGLSTSYTLIAARCACFESAVNTEKERHSSHAQRPVCFLRAYLAPLTAPSAHAQSPVGVFHLQPVPRRPLHMPRDGLGTHRGRIPACAWRSSGPQPPRPPSAQRAGPRRPLRGGCRPRRPRPAGAAAAAGAAEGAVAVAGPDPDLGPARAAAAVGGAAAGEPPR